MQATLRIEARDPEAVKRSIEVDEMESGRVLVEPRVADGVLVVEVEATDFTALRAGVTSFMRLAKIALDAEEAASQPINKS